MLRVLLVATQRGHHSIVDAFLDGAGTILDPWYVRHNLLRESEGLDAHHRRQSVVQHHIVLQISLELHDLVDRVQKEQHRRLVQYIDELVNDLELGLDQVWTLLQLLDEERRQFSLVHQQHQVVLVEQLHCNHGLQALN